MKRWLLPMVAAGGAVVVIGVLVVVSGIVPVNASSGHWRVTEWFLRFALRRSVATHSLGIAAPKLDDPALVLKGARHYETSCRSCHGAPGLPSAHITEGMLPRPPELGPRIEAASTRELFYVVKHGIKFTGMPAWPSQKRDDEVWAMVAFLLKMPTLDEAGYRGLARAESAAVTAGKPHTLDPAVSPALRATLQSCARCHDGDGSSAFPKLAGQRAEYLENALLAYASRQRLSGIMEPVAAALRAEEIRGIARYYSDQPTPVPANVLTNPNAAAIDRGRAIALDGIKSQRVPSCVECHGAGTARSKPEYPLLAGQPAAYLELQLQLFKREQRGGSVYAHLMRTVASRLTDEQMREVALYFESLDSVKNSYAETDDRGR